MGRGGFSWKRVTGISGAKSNISKKIGIPLTKSGRQQKIGRAASSGCAVTLLVLIIPMALLFTAILATACCNHSRTNTMQTNSRTQERIKTPEEIRAEQESREKQRLIEEEQRRQRLLNEQKQLLEAEIKSLDKPFNGSDLSRYTVGEMNLLIATFKTRAKMIREGEESDNMEIQKLAEKLKAKAAAYQTKSFPILRKAYAAGLNQELWIVDGKAYVSGNSNIYITVVSPELVQNKMKLEAHKAICGTLEKLRFRQARYKFYDGSDYTYWTVFEGKDADLIE